MTRASFHPDQICDRKAKKRSVGWSDSGSPTFLGVCGQLLTKSEFDQGLLVPAFEEGRNALKEASSRV
jgi:hypothetical protein